MEDFKPGDVVVLKSGGPNMTVAQTGDIYEQATAWCDWFEGTKKMSATFKPTSLERSKA